MNNNYLLEYSDTFSYLKQIQKIIKEKNFQNNITNEYDLVENTLDSVLEDLDTYSFLTEKKVIIIKNIDLLDINDKLTTHLLSYLKNPNTDNLLIMLSNKLDTRKKITKELKSLTNYLKLEINPEKIIKDELKEYNPSAEVIQMLKDYTNNNLDSIKNECDKLKQYKYPEKTICIEDIKNICYKSVNDTTQLTYDLVKYISSMNKKEALITYQKLHNFNIEDIGILALLESQLRLLEQVTLLMDENKKKQEIATTLEIHPYRIEKTMELLRNISKDEIENLLKKLGDLDLKIKSGIYDIKKPLEMFILNI